MAWYPLPPRVAVDINGNPVVAATVYAYADTAGATPVAMRDPITHAALAALTITNHVTPPVEVDIDPAAGGCYLKSGAAPACWVDSPQAMLAHALATTTGTTSAATTTAAGIVELATTDETTTGTDTARVVTPASLATALASRARIVGSGRTVSGRIVVKDSTSTTGLQAGDLVVVVPA